MRQDALLLINKNYRNRGVVLYNPEQELKVIRCHKSPCSLSPLLGFLSLFLLEAVNKIMCVKERTQAYYNGKDEQEHLPEKSFSVNVHWLFFLFEKDPDRALLNLFTGGLSYRRLFLFFLPGDSELRLALRRPDTGSISLIPAVLLV